MGRHTHTFAPISTALLKPKWSDLRSYALQGETEETATMIANTMQGSNVLYHC